jgi:hypothetical protein
MTAAVAYLRRSSRTAKGVAEVSIAAQEAAVRDLAARDGNNGDLVVFTDAGRSGDEAKISKRSSRMHQSSLTLRQARLLPIAVALAMAFTLIASLAITGTVRAAIVTLTAELTAAAEVPTPGPEGATGTASITLNDATGEVCSELTIDLLGSDEGAVVAAHIHTGEAGVAGDVVVPLITDPSRAIGLPDGSIGLTECVEVEDLELVADIIANPGAYYVNIHTEDFEAGAVRGQLAAPDDGAGTTTVMVMKHNCEDVMTEADFEAVEARAATNPLTPDAAFGPTVETVLECPTVVLQGDPQTENAVAGGVSAFDFTVAGQTGGAMQLSSDGVYEMLSACEPGVEYDADRSGTLDAGVCLDLSHYEFEVAAGTVTVTETTPPAGFTFGTLRFTPGSGDEATLVSASNGVIVLDTSADEDGMVMLHVYNFAVAAAPPAPTPAPTPGALPDTAASGTLSGAIAALAAMLVVLTSLGVLAVRTRRVRG